MRRAALAVVSLLASACDEPPRRLAPPQKAMVDPVLAARGEQLFLQGPCAMCHAVRGTQALSRVGPDLTHVASRRMLAAGTIPNTRGHLAGWILNPQSIKPGTKMPPTQWSADDLRALLAYLETLD